MSEIASEVARLGRQQALSKETTRLGLNGYSKVTGHERIIARMEQKAKALLKRAELTNQLIVLVDDSAVVRKIVKASLHRAGYEDVRTFPDGIELLRWLISPEARSPALVLVDLNMPKMDGYDLMRRLKAKPAFARTVFVILSGRAGVLDKLKGRLGGASVYLTKPFTTQEMVAVVEACVGPALRPPTPSAYDRG
jgi:twitching motility two-component system response regulator PilG